MAKNQDPSPSQGDSGQDQQKAGTSEVQDQMAQLQQRLEQAKQEAEAAKKEAKTHQQARDRLQSRMDRLATSRRPTPAQRSAPSPRQPIGGGGAKQEQPVDENLVEFANEQAKEAILYRELLRRGLTEEDVEGIEFDSPQELGIQLTIIEQTKEIAALKAQYESSREQDPGQDQGTTSQVRIDTGGVTRTEAQQQAREDLNALDDQAKGLYGQRKYREATWVALSKIHKDPRNRLPVRPSDLIE